MTTLMVIFIKLCKKKKKKKASSKALQKVELVKKKYYLKLLTANLVTERIKMFTSVLTTNKMFISLLTPSVVIWIAR